MSYGCAQCVLAVGALVSQKLCVCWLRAERTFGSLRHCVEADLFAMTESRWEMSQMSRVGIQSGCVQFFGGLTSVLGGLPARGEPALASRKFVGRSLPTIS